MVGECWSWNADLLSEVVQGAQRSRWGSHQAGGVAGQGGRDKTTTEKVISFSAQFIKYDGI